MEEFHITYFQAVLLGLLQGLTEFLPVSSTAHMAVAPRLLFGMDDPGAAFSAVVQLGPIVAITVFFRRDLIRYALGVLRTRSPFNLPPADEDARLGWFVLLGTLPLVAFGVLLERQIDTVFRSLYVIAASLIVLALFLWWAERVGARNKRLEDMSFGESQVIAWAQVLALIPGTSRSGVTITAGLFQGLDRESAARFSFLLSIPAITAAGAYKLLKVVRDSHGFGIAGPSLLGALVAGCFAYAVVRWFLGFMEHHDTRIFIGYRIALGLLMLFLLRSGYLEDRHPEEPGSSFSAASGQQASAGGALFHLGPLTVPHCVGSQVGHPGRLSPFRDDGLSRPGVIES